jgi:hypothetical protein
VGLASDGGNVPTLRVSRSRRAAAGVLERALVVFDLEPSFSAAADLPVAQPNGNRSAAKWLSTAPQNPSCSVFLLVALAGASTRGG